MGHEVEVCLRPCANVEEFYKANDVPYRLLQISGKVNPFALGRVDSVVREFKPDVVHTHLSTASLRGLKAAEVLGVPGIGHVHSNNSAWPYRRATVLVPVSTSVKEHIVKQGIDPAKCEVIHPASNVSGAEPAKDIAALGNAVISCAAHLREGKGILVLLEAFKIVHAQVPEAWLVLCGEGPLRNMLQREAKHLPILVPGYRPDVPSVFAASAVSALVSTKREGFPLALVESQSTGTPVVTTDTGWATEAIIHGKTGFALPAGDHEAVAKAILTILQDPERRKQMGEAAREFAKGHTMRRSAEQMVDLFERVSAKK